MKEIEFWFGFAKSITGGAATLENATASYTVSLANGNAAQAYTVDLAATGSGGAVAADWGTITATVGATSNATVAVTDVAPVFTVAPLVNALDEGGTPRPTPPASTGGQRRL